MGTIRSKDRVKGRFIEGLSIEKSYWGEGVRG